jgi:hypothetical protein
MSNSITRSYAHLQGGPKLKQTSVMGTLSGILQGIGSFRLSQGHVNHGYRGGKLESRATRREASRQLGFSILASIVHTVQD